MLTLIACMALPLASSQARTAATDEPMPPLLPAPAAPETPPEGPVYRVDYEARVIPSERTIHVSITLGSGARHLNWVRFRIDPERHSGFVGDGEVIEDEGYVRWTPGPEGRKLHYQFRIDRLRDERSYDARCARTWAIFRGGDMIPPTRVRHADGARSRSRLSFVLPEGWSVAAPYPRLRGGLYRVEHEGRAFDRPVGWFALGDLGVVRESVAETQLAIAGPVRHGLHRMDILALLRWTLPELNRIRHAPLERLLIVGAGDPMWRGGLSGPGSLFVHAERPLISLDGTSPVLHEMVHTAMAARADDDADWIVEGLAEYYSIQLLLRSGTVAPERFKNMLEKNATSEKDPTWRTHGGTATRVGVRYMQRLDAAIRRESGGERSLDDVLRVLTASSERTSFERLRRAVAEATQLEPDAVMPPAPQSAQAKTTSGR